MKDVAAKIARLKQQVKIEHFIVNTPLIEDKRG
jgi:hypothetical protein